MKLTSLERALRRRERTRLLAYLLKGGLVVKEELPAGAVAWTRITRSGSPFSDRCVTKLCKRGATVIRGTKYMVVEDQHGRVGLTVP